MSIENNASQPSHQLLRILVVNNHNQALDAILTCLEEAQFQTIHAVNSAQQALRLLRNHPIDLLILDVDTPDLDGWRLSRLVRSGILHCRADLPIVLTAQTWCERIAEVTAREYGINLLVPLEQLASLPQALRQIAQAPQQHNHKPRLLVIEDEPDTADLIRRVLSQHFDIEVANQGDTGLAAWRSGHHDLVLLDIMLPKLSGRDILSAIQAEAPEQPVVIMTAHTTIDQAEELMLLGAVDFLPKPFRAEQLRKVCDIAIRREDYLVSNAQFAARVQSLEARELAFRQLYENHHQLLNDLQSVVIELDHEFHIHYLNNAWQNLFGFDVEECIGQPLDEFIAPEDLSQFALYKNKVRKALTQGKACPKIELCFNTNHQQRLWALVKVSRSGKSEGRTSLTMCLDNVTEQRESEAQLKYLAIHDSLTGLYNRHFFETNLAQLTADSSRYQNEHSLIYLDLDHFKVINDTFGHQRGDEILRNLSHLLSQQVRPNDSLYRLGGDEFAVLMRDTNTGAAHEFALSLQAIVASFSFTLQDHQISLGSSIGITLIDGSTHNPEEHLMRADIALYVAKGRGRNLIHLYNPLDSESDELRQSINMCQRVRKAIVEDRISLYFQPIYDVKAACVSYYETLVRLCEADGNIIGPCSFIPALEAANEMHLLDRWIIKLAIRHLRDHPGLNHIAINLSAQAFKDEQLMPMLLSELEATGVDPHRITFELTESASLFNLHVTQRIISELHQLGCSFSIDDFGSGFSSFAYLKDLPADYIKLDGSFIQHLDTDEIDQTLVRSMIQVIQALGKKAVAEYVENQAIMDILIDMGVDFVQGFHIGVPQPVALLGLK